ncbi:ABC transporter ATP-binding protein [Ochrobactrum quorumnocens]|jgi:putative spermidine/putrescine transport system ATP-binding protein|uniref:ABC transporter ATP-binding protein n=1 Tax=Ochrobactrum quorumnocens TaxID=271865 RepID=A0A5N1JUJ2_9HYPH|nr:ABC transporter ATP-binding protein [[Ochrobactrum] quorumnocens]KAA9366918.1 ABC transporter ATP-binding protein [[Ochrobactrum] quorumnocens]MBD7989188.1 ABC transporter ATP-binding protein [Ochrobactrum gallinarum]
MSLHSQDGASALVLKAVTKRFGANIAVDSLDLTIDAGKLVSLLGPSGCGKTTTLRMVAGFEGADSGTIHIGGTNVTNLPPHRRRLGMVFQNYSLFPHRTVAENIGFGLKMQGAARAERYERIRSMLDLIQLSGRGDAFPSQLSGGQQQRVALARSLVVNPKVLLLDEPLSALDKSLRESMQFEIRAMQARLGITTLLVTHDQEEALSMADEVAVMNKGRILQLGTPGEIYDKPQSRFVAEFLGASNIFEGQASPDGASLLVGGKQGSVALPLPTRQPSSQPLTLSVRPERIAPVADGNGLLNGRVVGAVFRGNYAAYQIDVPALGREIFIYRQAESRLGELAYHLNQEITLGWNPQDAVVVTSE